MGRRVRSTQPAYDDKDQTSDLWLVPADGSAAPRRLTSTKAAESGVAWSADSRRIAFATKREGDDANQIYSPRSRERRRGGARDVALDRRASPAWRPDGKAILFTSLVYPNAADDAANKKIAAERKDQKYKVRAYDSFPVRYWDRWLDDRQIHVFVQSLEPRARREDLLAGTKLVAEPRLRRTPARLGRGIRRRVGARRQLDRLRRDDQSYVSGVFATVHTHLYQVPPAAASRRS